MNVTDVLFAGTTTVAGTINCEDDTPTRDNAIVMPPAGAALDSVTVHVAVPEAEIVVGLHVSDDSVAAGPDGAAGGGASVREALLDTPPYEPVT